MKIVIAPDSFKGSLSSVEVSRAIQEGFSRVYPMATYDRVPIADGGEGTVHALVEATGGHTENCVVTGPLGDKVESFYGILGDGHTAVIEMAAASGLGLIPPDRRNPMIATTFGTGELIRQTLDKGAKKIIIGIGGSATNDGGAGMAQALGVKFLDSKGCMLGFGGRELSKLATIDISELDTRILHTEIVAACDVRNPLTGPEGASAFYGPQKGATQVQIQSLDRALCNYADIVEHCLNIKVAGIPGSGAAGGLGAGLIAFAGAKLVPGINLVLDVVGLFKRMQDAHLVITGEGSLDEQTVYGKAPIGVAKMAKNLGIPVIGIAGTLGSSLNGLIANGIDALTTSVPGPVSLDEAMSSAMAYLVDASERAARLLKVGQMLG